MSTFFATFDDLRQVRGLLDELVRSGVRPDDISVVTRQVMDGVDTRAPMVEPHVTVGDATAFVGRDDDPDLGEGVAERAKNLADLTTTVHSEVGGGISTVDRGKNVDSVDQADDSQLAAEDQAHPPRETSHSEHEHDDLALAVRTGFPTTVPLQDDVRDTDGPLQEQFAESLEIIVVPESGTVIGGGALATAALDLINPEANGDFGALHTFLKDIGVPASEAQALVRAFRDGRVLLGVGIAPGRVREGALESMVDRWGGRDGALFDAPRFYENGKRDRNEGYVS